MDQEGAPEMPIVNEASYGRLFGIVCGNLVLTLLTLGIYGFWARVRVRRYIWGTTRIAGEPLEYTGTGGELLRGALITLALVIVPLILLQFGVDYLTLGDPFASERGGPGQVVVGVVILYLGGLAIFRATRYRLRRSDWMSIGSTMRGNGWRYAALSFFSLIHVGLTLGLTKPLRDGALARAIYPRMIPVGVPLTMDSGFRPPWGRWLLCWLLVLPTLGASLAWYDAAFYRRLAGALRWQGLRADSTATGGQMLRLLAGNLLIIVLSLTLLSSLASLRSWRFWCRHLRLRGELDLAALRQTAETRERTGEGLASALDIDAI